MYTPKFSYSDKIVNNLLKIEEQKVRIENNDLSYNSRVKLANQNKTVDIFHMGHMLMVNMSLSDADKYIKSGKHNDYEFPKSVILNNFRNVLDFNRSSAANNYAEFDKAVILHINKLMQHEWKETWEANLRNFNDKVDDRWDNFNFFRDEEVMPSRIEAEIDELVAWYKYSQNTIPAIVRISITMLRLFEISPFVAANKFVIAGILDYLLTKNGYGNNCYVSITRILDSNEEKFLKNFEVVKQTKEISYIIDTFITCILDDFSKAQLAITEFKKKEEKQKEQPFLDLNKRQLKILKYLQSVPTIKREDYCYMMDVSTMTAFRDLKDLVRKKLLKIDGKGRGTRYKLASY